MAENLYACIYFPSDKTVSVILKSRCILRGEFKELGEVEVKWRVQGKNKPISGLSSVFVQNVSTTIKYIFLMIGFTFR